MQFDLVRSLQFQFQPIEMQEVSIFSDLIIHIK